MSFFLFVDYYFLFFFFFFQAEDGIRDKLVTGVQTCALPISPGVFLRYAGLTLALVAAGAAALIFVLAPRLAAVAAGLPSGLWLGLARAPALSWLWFALLLPFFYGQVLPLPQGGLRRRALLPP